MEMWQNCSVSINETSGWWGGGQEKKNGPALRSSGWDEGRSRLRTLRKGTERSLNAILVLSLGHS